MARIVAKVRSSDGVHWYNVTKQRVGHWTCTCKAFHFTPADDKGHRHPCKHQLKLFQGWRRGYLRTEDVQVIRPDLL